MIKGFCDIYKNKCKECPVSKFTGIIAPLDMCVNPPKSGNAIKADVKFFKELKVWIDAVND